MSPLVITSGCIRHFAQKYGQCLSAICALSQSCVVLRDIIAAHSSHHLRLYAPNDNLANDNIAKALSFTLMMPQSHLHGAAQSAIQDRASCCHADYPTHITKSPRPSLALKLAACPRCDAYLHLLTSRKQRLATIAITSYGHHSPQLN